MPAAITIVRKLEGVGKLQRLVHGLARVQFDVTPDRVYETMDKSHQRVLLVNDDRRFVFFQHAECILHAAEVRLHRLPL